MLGTASTTLTNEGTNEMSSTTLARLTCVEVSTASGVTRRRKAFGEVSAFAACAREGGRRIHVIRGPHPRVLQSPSTSTGLWSFNARATAKRANALPEGSELDWIHDDEEPSPSSSSNTTGEVLPLYTNFSDAIEDWQLLLLEEAYDTSCGNRKKVSITSLSLECKLSRSQVLEWLKSRSKLSDEQAATIRAACLAAVEREESLEDTVKKKEAKRAFSKLSIGEKRQVQSKSRDRLSPLAMKTLLKFWGRNKDPSWQHINDIARMTKLSPTTVRNWFKMKRDEEGPSKSAGARRRRRKIR